MYTFILPHLSYFSHTHSLSQPLSEELLRTSHDLEQAKCDVDLLRAEVNAAQMMSEQNSSALTDGSMGDTEGSMTALADDTTLTPRENGPTTALLIDLEDTEDQQTCEASPTPVRHLQQPDLLGDCVLIPDSPGTGSDGESQGHDGGGGRSLVDHLTNHSSLSQELF